MRIIDADDGWLAGASPRFHELVQFVRKFTLFLHGVSISRSLNAGRSLLAFIFRRPHWVRFPIHIKVDVSPMCQMSCPVCIHGQGTPFAHKPRLLKKPLFEKLVDEVWRHTAVLSLYNLGEPLLNPALPEMIAYAAKHGLSTYVTTNLSVRLSERSIEALVSSGLKSLLVAVDGISKETFGRQRIGGKFDLIFENARALVEERRKQGSAFPRLQLQFLVFDFNRHEKPLVAQFARDLGFDEVHFVRGATTPWIAGAQPIAGPPKGPSPLPRCSWPYFSAVVLSNGQIAGCCKYRMSDIYDGGTITALGDVSTATFGEIYRGTAYRMARAMSSNPRSAGVQQGHFCNGCASLYSEKVTDAGVQAAVLTAASAAGLSPLTEASTQVQD
ncbi:molybdenum cofactor biosynthesis protein A [Variibacter gotjawalensis]|uniref:Molybdenum cofactor biosynthesis protein A n=1 Tax=Variibacter gotjawalensis TaxID=1333996 RepID=A0A0S3PZX5_9BRAD|nr:radical SAM protein [Variibacter gotjawalensis]NIK47329.1 organic radical activating enzyme [Variibacter gotjawalensis]RZS49227.1 radical SAM family protein [Variibacter gotjawalensis]BAT61489.1 molybdenum cofactor biosynthesis protein A [Variibacter gotjawalensis]